MLQDNTGVGAIFNLTCSDMSKIIGDCNARLAGKPVDDTNLRSSTPAATYEQETDRVGFYGAETPAKHDRRPHSVLIS